ncbi:MAG: DUF547 domain-containing protein [Nonlabens sp.]|nr:DUF547 domain-containing protein [Nonlabens sp.]
MKKILFILGFVLLNSCIGSKNLHFTKLAENEQLENAAKNELDHSSWDAQLKKHVNAKGFVDYEGWKKDTDELQAYLAYLNDNAPKKGWSQAEQFAFYINLYNAATVNMILENGIPKSIKDIDGPFGQVWLKDAAYVNGKSISLASLEKSILQKMGDPRMHFAINCASFSCPKLQRDAYVATKINDQMDNAAKEFVNSDKNDLANSAAPKISEIFKFYPQDFKESGLSILEYVNQYANKKVDTNAPLEYVPYDWSLNKQ